jgi:antitoxin component of MazEF toxin-antitoxin module
MMATTDERSKPHNAEQAQAQAIWQALPAAEWLPKDEFLEWLRKREAIGESEDNALSALFLGLHAADYVEVTRSNGQEMVRRAQERPRTYTLQEQMEHGDELKRLNQRKDRDSEDKRKKELAEELKRLDVAEEERRFAELLEKHSDHRRIVLLEAQQRRTEARLKELEQELAGTGVAA